MPAEPHDDHPGRDRALTRRGHVTNGLALAALLSLVLGLLSACGGDDEPDSIAIDAEIEITAERDSSATSTTAERSGSDESDAMAAPTITAASEQVRLGNRFDWCADIQRVWDERDKAAVALAAGEAALEEAQRAQDLATDELDRAEATDAYFDAYDQLYVLGSDHTRAAEAAIEQLHRARGSVTTGTEGVALERAWEALIAADPAVAAASDAVPADEPLPEHPDTALRGLEDEVRHELGVELTGPPEENPEESDQERDERLAKEREAQEAHEAVEKELERRIAEIEREWNEYRNLASLLWETVAGSPGYTAFKESLRESCA
ncbi:MAG: hypothetical protein F4Y12_08875 [Acidimicrobiaceae bacterium]|nr:hypothetical protein [Acidimicrobiaceae bacterium]MYH76357.1 hypothetical protein [Acidimicrobiaceae bacterium]